MEKQFWRKYGAVKNKRRARSIAKGLRAPGDDKVRARIIKEVWWRVEYMEPVK